jgi:hypothetical protein
MLCGCLAGRHLEPRPGARCRRYPRPRSIRRAATWSRTRVCCKGWQCRSQHTGPASRPKFLVLCPAPWPYVLLPAPIPPWRRTGRGWVGSTVTCRARHACLPHATWCRLHRFCWWCWPAGWLLGPAAAPLRHGGRHPAVRPAPCRRPRRWRRCATARRPAAGQQLLAVPAGRLSRRCGQCNHILNSGAATRATEAPSPCPWARGRPSCPSNAACPLPATT